MVKWSRLARNDLKLIYEYIAHDSKIYAKKVVNEIVNKSEYIESFPQMG
ncbi:type II toxin-antitoxin system RelE/ParE family toxin [Maledivibacter halophilus]|nr:type II toxin-antitoxin system RelE/ParE family toxin [Maledivibacter halophilus]